MAASPHGSLVTSVKVRQVLQHNIEVGVVDTLVQVGQHGLVLVDVVDDRYHEAHGVLVCYKMRIVCPGQLHEDQARPGSSPCYP